MSDLFWLSYAPMARLQPDFANRKASPRGDGWRVLGGLIILNRKDLRWRETLWAYGPKRCTTTAGSVGATGGFARIMAFLAAKHGEELAVLIDATHLKARRTASSAAGKGGMGLCSGCKGLLIPFRLARGLSLLKASHA